ncbi:MAG TPA: hypothetical protein VFT99_19140, partial [Roseiflexaceae bacterium]|nr:hypothetical protein [Roseiflexaceae bacterium]
ITDTIPTLDTLSSVVGDDMPRTISTTRQALDSAQSTARVADQLLTAISSIGLLNAQVYNPQVPLNVAIGQVAQSLDALPTSLSRMKTSINSASGSLLRVQQDTAGVASSVGEIRASLTQARDVLSRYQNTVTQLHNEVTSARSALPTWLSAVRWGGGLLMIWLGAAQIGLITQGMEYSRRARQEL